MGTGEAGGGEKIVTKCVHHWLVPPVVYMSQPLVSRCKKCGAEKVFPSMNEIDRQIALSARRNIVPSVRGDRYGFIS